MHERYIRSVVLSMFFLQRMNRVHQVPCSSPVLCGRLGPKTQLLAVGSVDRRVTLHPLSGGIPAALSNHPTPVEAVAFDRSEECIATGCSGGSVWLWDVATETQLTTFPGHRSNCTVAEYHPFGSFFATGSADTNVKIWDARQSKCVQTYRSHASGVTAIRFSPHGRWLVTGDLDGVVKMWDLTGGKALASVEAHSGSVTGIDFHPTDFFLVSGSADKTTKLWNCETASLVLVGASDFDSSGVQNVRFSPDGAGLVVANHTGLKTFTVDGDTKRIACTSAQDFGDWKGLLDLVVMPDGNVMAVSANDDSVSVWSNEKGRGDPIKPTMSSAKKGVSVRDRVLESKSERKENTEPCVQRVDSLDSVSRESPVVDTPRRNDIRAVLSRRLMSVRAICALWAAGNTKGAVDEAIALSPGDPTIFVSVLCALPLERTKSALSIDSCTKVLKHVATLGLLTLPFTHSQPMIDAFASLPFSNTLPLVLAVDSSSRQPHANASDLAFIATAAVNAVAYLARRFGPILADLRKAAPLTAGPDFAREERTAKAVACADQFAVIADVLADDVKWNKMLRKEKEEAIREIVTIQQIR